MITLISNPAKHLSLFCENKPLSLSQKVKSLIFEWVLNTNLLMVHINFFVNDEFDRKNSFL